MNTVRHDLVQVRTPDLRSCRTGLCGHKPLHAHRFEGELPRWQPWGAWELALTGIDGNVLHWVDRVAWWPYESAQRQSGEPRLEHRS